MTRGKSRDLTPPAAPRRPKRTRIHGQVRTDPYAWLREREDPQVMEYLKAENNYAKSVMSGYRGLEKTLYEEMLSRIKQTDVSVPSPDGQYFYYSRTEEGRQYPIFCRKLRGREREEEVLLDPNRHAKKGGYLGVGLVEVSPDHQWLAYSLDTKGQERYTLRFRNLRTGRHLPGIVEDTATSGAWSTDNQTFLYTRLDAANRPYQVWAHRLGGKSPDCLLMQEDDEAFFVDVSLTRSQAYLLISSESKTSSEVRFTPAAQPLQPLRIVQPRRPNHEYSIDHSGDFFYILTNSKAINFRLMRTPVEKPGEEHWRQLIAPRKDVKLDAIEAFADYLALFERGGGNRQLRVVDLKTRQAHPVVFEEPAYTVFPGANFEFATRVLRVHYTSLVTPLTVYDYRMDRRKLRLRKRSQVLGGFRAQNYVTERVFARTDDGTKIPITLLRLRSRRAQHPEPFYLYGYGSYGISMDPIFSSNRLSLVDRGVGFAIAHVRGGGELGRPWYESGKLLSKKNTFSDFIRCAETLIRRGYTQPDRLVISGGSAGGLLIGAVINQRPELFHAAVASVPFVDVINTMLDAGLPLTITEYEEWGNPQEEHFFEYMLDYSPYDNVRTQAYPHILITAGLNDPRVQYWEPAKWAARLRETKTDDHLLLLKTNLGAGHAGASGRYDRLKEIAFEYTFLLACLGLASTPVQR